MESTAIILLSLSIVNGFDYSNRCLFFNGSCVRYCPRLMHPYHTRCDRDTLSQRTCDEPLVYTIGFTCGWSRCDCNGDLCLDEKSMLCVDVEYCTRYQKPYRRRQGRRRFSKKIKIPDGDKDLIDMK